MELVTKLVLHDKTRTSYDLYTETNVYLGQIDKLEDGYFAFKMGPEVDGYFSSFNLRLIGEKLDEVNKEWDTQITKYFDDEKKRN